MKKILFTSLSILLLAAACQKQAAVQPAPNPQPQNQQEQKTQSESPSYTIDTPPPLPNFDNGLPLAGILKFSDNPKKGNLMLVETDATSAKTGKSIKIYLQTQRDFSALIDKKVIASIKGAPGSFVLVDVKEIK